MVIVGGHRDAWGPGAADNVSGTVSVLEAARAVAEAVKAGHRPKRTIIFATWDAEEWGLIGSTEYVEDDSLRLMRRRRRVPQPGRRRAGRALRRRRLAVAARRRCATSRGGARPERARQRVRRVAPRRGGGRHARSRRWAIRAAAPTSPASTTTSAFPSPSGASAARGACTTRSTTTSRGCRRFGDPSFAYHAAAARIAAAMVLRLANADDPPVRLRRVRAHDAAATCRRWTARSARSGGADRPRRCATAIDGDGERGEGVRRGARRARWRPAHRRASAAPP